MSGAVGRKSFFISRKSRANLVPDLVDPRTDRRPEPGDDPGSRHPHRVKGSFDDPRGQSTPPGVRRRDHTPRLVGQKHRHAVGKHHRAYRSRRTGHRRIGGRRFRFRVGIDDPGAVDLLEPHRLLRQQRPQLRLTRLSRDIAEGARSDERPDPRRRGPFGEN